MTTTLLRSLVGAALLLACDPGAGTMLGAGPDVGQPGDMAGAPASWADSMPGDRPSADASVDPKALRCGAPAPVGAVLAPLPPAYSGGQCPQLAPGPNSLVTAGGTREFKIYVPASMTPGERLPVIFMWHYLNATADKYAKKLDLQAAVDQQRFIAVLPEAKWDLAIIAGLGDMPWPITREAGEARLEEELTFFDDMLACVSERFDVDLDCVSISGTSAGALFAPLVASARSQHLASMVLLSGGVGGFDGPMNPLLKSWSPPLRSLPALVLWGGAADSWPDGLGLLDFDDASRRLEQSLTDNGHFVLECVHNCGHTLPPMEPPTGKSALWSLWEFALSHPFWLPVGSSPFQVALPPGFESWCAAGMGQAVPRSGDC